MLFSFALSSLLSLLIMPIAFTSQTKLCQPDSFPKQNWFCSGRYRLILLWQRPFPRGWITQPRNQILTHWVATTEWAELEPRPNGLSWYNCESILSMAMCIRTSIMTMWIQTMALSWTTWNGKTINAQVTRYEIDYDNLLRVCACSILQPVALDLFSTRGARML